MRSYDVCHSLYRYEQMTRELTATQMRTGLLLVPVPALTDERKGNVTLRFMTVQ